MTAEERAKALIGDAPLVMESIIEGVGTSGMKDFIKQLTVCICVAVEEEREACARAADQEVEAEHRRLDEQIDGAEIKYAWGAEAVARRIRDRSKS